MAGKGRGARLSPGEESVKMIPLKVPKSLAMAVRSAADAKGIPESEWRRDAYTEKLSRSIPSEL